MTVEGAVAIIAGLVAALAVKEGREAWRGEGCCVASPVPVEPAACADDCCAR